MHQKVLNKTDKAVLESIRLHSVSQCATKLLVETIANEVGKSKLTVRRSLSKLVRLNIIDRISTYRPVNVGQGASILVIRPFISQDDTPEMIHPNRTEKLTTSTDEPLKNESVSFSFITKNSKPSPIDDTFPTERPTLYQRIKSLIKDRKQAREFYAIYRAQSLRLLKFDHLADKVEQLEIICIQALSITMKSNSVRNIYSYFSGTLRNVIDKALFSDAYKDYSVDPMQLCTH